MIEGIIAVIMAVFAAVATVVSNAVSSKNQSNINQQNLDAAEETREDQQAFNAAAAQQANAWTLSNFNATESPAAMRRMYENAGMSVGLMYGQGGTGGSSHAGAQAQGTNLMAPLLNPTIPFGSMNDAFGNAGQVAEAANKIKDTEKKGTEIEEIQENIKNLQEERNKIIAEIQKTYKDIELKDVQITNTALNNVAKELENAFNTITFNERTKAVEIANNKALQEIEKLRKEIELLDIDTKYKEKLYNAQIRLYEAQAAEQWTRAGLNKAQEELAKYEKVYKQGMLYQENRKVGAMIEETKAKIKEINQNVETKNWELENYYHIKATQGSGTIGGTASEIFSLLEALKEIIVGNDNGGPIIKK